MPVHVYYVADEHWCVTIGAGILSNAMFLRAAEGGWEGCG